MTKTTEKKPIVAKPDAFLGEVWCVVNNRTYQWVTPHASMGHWKHSGFLVRGPNAAGFIYSLSRQNATAFPMPEVIE